MDFTTQAAHKRHPWYNRRIWRDRLQPMVLRRDPICVLCNRAVSRIADHIVPFKGIWELFVDLTNLRGVCKECHDKKTASQDGGFGNPIKKSAGAPTPVMTGEPGKQFASSTVGQSKLDAALADVDALLEGI